VSGSTFLVPMGDLTPDQRRIVQLPPQGHRVVFGPPGSGKTLVLIHRAAHLAQSLGIGEDRFRVVVFTNVLKDYIRSGLEFLHIPPSSVVTFAALCQGLYRTHVSRRVPWDDVAHAPDFAAIQTGVLTLLKRRRDLQQQLDFTVVDEGQDLGKEAFTILSLLSKHVTVFADPLQRIFAGGAGEDEILQELGLPRRSGNFLAAFRNSPDVAQLASWYISGAGERAEYLRQVRNVLTPRERPLLYEAASPDEELDRLAESIQNRMAMRHRVGVIVPRSRTVFGVAKALQQRGVEVERAVPPKGPRDTTWLEIGFDNLVPKIATYHSAKSLTFDTVYLPRLYRGAFAHVDSDDDVARLLFVGIARATQWVCLSTVCGHAHPALSVLHTAAEHGHIVIQSSRVQGRLDFDDEEHRREPLASGIEDGEEDEGYSLL